MNIDTYSGVYKFEIENLSSVKITRNNKEITLPVNASKELFYLLMVLREVEQMRFSKNIQFIDLVAKKEKITKEVYLYFLNSKILTDRDREVLREIELAS